MSIRSRLTRIALPALVLAAAACGADNAAPNPTPNVGGTTYQLVGVDPLANLGGGGDGIPVTFVDGSGKTLKFESGFLQLNDDGSFDLTLMVAFNGDEYDAGDLGTWTADGATIALASELDGASYTATVSGSDVTTTYKVAGLQFELRLNAE